MSRLQATSHWQGIYLTGLSAIELVGCVIMHILTYFGAVSMDLPVILVGASTVLTWLLAQHAHLGAVYDYHGWEWPGYIERAFSRDFRIVSLQLWTKREYADIGMSGIPAALRRWVMPFLLASLVYVMMGTVAESGTWSFIQWHSRSLLLVSMAVYNFSIYYSRLKRLGASVEYQG